MFKRVIAALLLSFGLAMPAVAQSVVASVNEILNSFDFDRDSVVSIAVKDKDGYILYEKNRFKYLNPASILKLFSMAASQKVLGENFNFETVFYKDLKNNYYLKLSADPMLMEEDLEILAEKLKMNAKGKLPRIFIDDSVIDLIPYPDGWAADDFWPNSPKISPYMVDKNTVKVEFYYNKEENNVRILQKSPYRFSFVNRLQGGAKDDIKISFDEIHNVVNLDGTIASSYVAKNIPVLNPKYFFCKKLNQALNKKGIKYSDKFQFAKTPKEAKPVVSFKRPLDEVIRHILYTSDNVAAEMVFKRAGAKYAKENSPLLLEPYTFGTNQNSVNMFYDFYEKLGLDIKGIKIHDGSGVSRYNALDVDWMSSALAKLDFDFEKYLPTAGVGTLAKRMRNLEGEVYFKTGTLYGVSSLAGIIKTKKGIYYYTSSIMGFNRSSSLIKGVEDEIVYEIYRIENDE